MAQLRDAQTSELIAEGTPLEVAIVARRIGFDEVLFDDVGENFDPAATLDAYDRELAGLEQAVAAAKGEARAELEEHREERAGVADAALELEPDAAAALEAARARLD